MPVIRMPNGDMFDFPDDMPREEIRRKILEKFPDSINHPGLIGQFVRGYRQGVAGTMLDASNFLYGEGQHKGQIETEKFVNEPSAGTAQNIGRTVGGALPYAVLAPAKLAGLAAQKSSEAAAGAIPSVAGAGIQALMRKLGMPSGLAHMASDYARTHPWLLEAAQQARPAAGEIGGAIGRNVTRPVAGAVGGIREIIRGEDGEDSGTE